MPMTFQTIRDRIEAWLADRANNALGPEPEYADLPAFDTPLVGCAPATDPLFARVRELIGPEFYWTPQQAFAEAFPDDLAEPEDLSVIAWILPQTAATRAAQRKAKEVPSIPWSLARHYGELVNESLRRYVVQMLAAEGVQAVAPTLLPTWSRARSQRFGIASSWSERHTAHVCGLGTFGLSDGLITPKGKAMRVGTAVVRANLEPTPRTYTSHTEWCLHYAKGKCVACMRRCPIGAISEAGHDKEACQAYLAETTSVYVEREQLGFKVSACGLCQTGVPCESGNPTARKTKSEQ